MRKIAIPAEVPATSLETKKSLLQKASRKVQAAPIRVTFLQRGTGKGSGPGPLAKLVSNHDDLALDLYLFVLAMASSHPYAIRRSASVLARALARQGKEPVGPPTISKAWARLQNLQLITRSRFGRIAEITLLREDGTGVPYTHPGASVPAERYLKLPFAYWHDDWNATLSLPEKAVLLIGLTLGEEFRLPIERASTWYGLSADTINRGLDDLRRNGLLRYTDTPKKAPLSPKGYTLERRYTLQGPFTRAKPVTP